MPQYVAFLRAINVSNRRIKMDRLREAFTTLGFANVSTFIASGNVLFESPELNAAEAEARIEAHLPTALGFPSETFLRSSAEIAELLALRPFPAEDVDTPGHRWHVSFLRSAPGEEVARKVLDFRTERDEFHVQGRELHWLSRGPISDTKVSWTRLGKLLAMPYTDRNIGMLRQIGSKLKPLD